MPQNHHLLILQVVSLPILHPVTINMLSRPRFCGNYIVGSTELLPNEHPSSVSYCLLCIVRVLELIGNG